MRKQILMATMLLVLGITTSVLAKPVNLAHLARIDANPVTINGCQFVEYVMRYTDPKDMWHDNTVNFCADALRDGCNENLPLKFISTEGLVRKYRTPMEVISAGQSGVNLAHDEDWFNTLWARIPDNNLEVGNNLVCARSLPDVSIPHSGGTYLLYTGPGAPYVPSKNDVFPGTEKRDASGNIIAGTGVKILVPCGNAAIAKVVAPAPAKKAVTAVRKKVIKKVPCPDGTGICSQPCIIEIREGVEHLIESVGMPTKDEPADEKTLQQKARKTLDSVGVADKTDEADEKTLQQKARKGLKLKKEIHKAVGTSKSGRSLHDKLGESKRPNGQLIPVVEEMHNDIKDIKAHLNIPANKLNKCANCHNDMMQQKK
ncbi:MAG: hypothetical protein HGA36_04275 [Candidatus Moranbacteria bacterium]|nr:hypothetical protein [Candidatus Moranbacteria bacterium]